MLKTIRACSPATADLYDFDELVREDRVHRLIYTDPVIFEAELTNIWGAVWIYLGHESQIPSNNDFITTALGLRPIILIRDAAGKVRALFNRWPIAAPHCVAKSAAPRTCSPALTTVGAI